MALLPNAEHARVDDKKLFDYLLSMTHPEGGPKARFYASTGFTTDNAQALREQLLRIALDSEIIEILPEDYGTKYIVEGILFDKNKRGIPLLTVWVIDKGTDFPRLVTAYPL